MIVLLRKDIKELMRTRRVLFPPVLFLLLGIGGPLFVRLLPVILESAQQEMQMAIPDTTPVDGIVQYLSLVAQLGLLAVILLSMGVVASEKRDGLLAAVFVKPVSRLAYLWSRWLVNGTLIAASFLLGVAVAVGSSLLLLGSLPLGDVAAAGLLWACYVLLVFSWTFFFSSLTRGPGAAAGLSLLPFFLLPALGSLWDPLARWGPHAPAAAALEALGGGMQGPAVALPAGAFVVAGLDLVACVLLVLAAYGVLRKAEL